MDLNYHIFIRPDAGMSMPQIAERAVQFESLRARQKQRVRKTSAPPPVATAHNRSECCWRCKQRGHVCTSCQRPPRKFCSFCSKDGVFTRECHPPPGNDHRTERGATPVNLYYKPRPHISVHCMGRILCALIDSGAEKSYINPVFAEYLVTKSCRARAINETVSLADDTVRPIVESFLVAFRTEGRRFQHEFQVMPALGEEMLIGVDQWAQLGFWLLPSPLPYTTPNAKNAAISEGMIPRTRSENQRLQDFLQHELARSSASPPSPAPRGKSNIVYAFATRNRLNSAIDHKIRLCKPSLTRPLTKCSATALSSHPKAPGVRLS